MGRKKKVILAIEDIFPNSLRNEDGKYLNNFICYEEGLNNALKEMSRLNIWKDEPKKAEGDLEKLIKDYNNPKKSSYYFFTDDIAISEVSLSPKIKSDDEYIYRVRFTDLPSGNCDYFVSYKEIFSLVGKKVKNKNAIIIHNGNTERLEYSDEELANRIALESNNTCDVWIAQLQRDGGEGEFVEITIFKNKLKL